MSHHMQIVATERRKPNADEFLLDVQQAAAGWPWYHEDPYYVRIITVSAFFFYRAISFQFTGNRYPFP